MLDLVSMGQRIRIARENQGYTREQLAEMSNISPRFCYDIEAGVKGVSIDTLSNISAALHVSVDYLLSGEKTDKKDYTLFLALMDRCPEEQLENLQKLVRVYVDTITDIMEKKKTDK